MTLLKVEKSHWHSLADLSEISNLFGFVYLIRNKVTGQLYIGKKQFWSERHLKVEGRKNRKKVLSPSKWEKYTGSCTYLNDDIKKLGIDSFEFYIVETYRTRGGLYYAEANLQHKFDVMYTRLDKDLRLFYNGNIAAVKFIPREYSKESSLRIRQIIKGDIHV